MPAIALKEENLENVPNWLEVTNLIVEEVILWLMIWEGLSFIT